MEFQSVFNSLEDLLWNVLLTQHNFFHTFFRETFIWYLKVRSLSTNIPKSLSHSFITLSYSGEKYKVFSFRTSSFPIVSIVEISCDSTSCCFLLPTYIHYIVDITSYVKTKFKIIFLNKTYAKCSSFMD